MNRLPSPPVELGADEQRILRAFRTMDARGKRECLAKLETTAAKYPDRAAPTLRLVKGGVQ